MSDAAVGLLLVTVAVVGIVAFTVGIARSASSKVGTRILAAVQRVRLFKMLETRQVDVQRYVQDTDVAKIREQIATCESCPSAQTCDARLQGDADAAATKDFSFCPNDEAIAQIERAQR